LFLNRPAAAAAFAANGIALAFGGQAMLEFFKILIAIMLIFLALGFACAVWLAFRREPGIGPRGVKHPTAADPYAFPIGDVPGFSREQLDEVTLASFRRIARDPLRRSLDLQPSAGALRRKAAGRHLARPSGMPAGRTLAGDLIAAASIVVFGPIGVAIISVLFLAGYLQ
jgi:hypothetical protein